MELCCHEFFGINISIQKSIVAVLCEYERMIIRPIRWYSETSLFMQTSRCIWYWFQTNWIYHFSPRYFNGIKIVTAFKCIFEETVPKLSFNFRNHNSQDSHLIQYPGPVFNFGFMEAQYNDNLPLKCRIFPIGNTYRSYCINSAIYDSCSSWFVWNQLPCVGMMI